jgi:hypothetical protein
MGTGRTSPSFAFVPPFDVFPGAHAAAVAATAVTPMNFLRDSMTTLPHGASTMKRFTLAPPAILVCPGPVYAQGYQQPIAELGLVKPCDPGTVANRTSRDQ